MRLITDYSDTRGVDGFRIMQDRVPEKAARKFLIGLLSSPELADYFITPYDSPATEFTTLSVGGCRGLVKDVKAAFLDALVHHSSSLKRASWYFTSPEKDAEALGGRSNLGSGDMNFRAHVYGSSEDHLGRSCPLSFRIDVQTDGLQYKLDNWQGVPQAYAEKDFRAYRKWQRDVVRHIQTLAKKAGIKRLER